MRLSLSNMIFCPCHSLACSSVCPHPSRCWQMPEMAKGYLILWFVDPALNKAKHCTEKVSAAANVTVLSPDGCDFWQMNAVMGSAVQQVPPPPPVCEAQMGLFVRTARILKMMRLRVLLLFQTQARISTTSRIRTIQKFHKTVKKHKFRFGKLEMHFFLTHCRLNNELRINYVLIAEHIKVSTVQCSTVFSSLLTVSYSTFCLEETASV